MASSVEPNIVSLTLQAENASVMGRLLTIGSPNFRI